MATLTDEQKFRIVHLLATFRTPKQVQHALKEEFKVETSLPQIMFYDPASPQGSRELSQKWKDLFKDLRERYVDGVSEIGIAHLSYRLERLQEHLNSDLVAKNPVAFRETLKQAAMDVGGLFAQKKDAPLPGAGGAGEALLSAFGQALDKIYGEKPASPETAPALEAAPSGSSASEPSALEGADAKRPAAP